MIGHELLPVGGTVPGGVTGGGVPDVPLVHIVTQAGGVDPDPPFWLLFVHV
ncbi:MAG: hypothetical protein ACMG6E_04250 [Candidatus Roizmanbacteria bacterium]